MMILYGDYKDMNYVAEYENGKPDSVSVEEMEFLRPYWKKFINGELNLVKRRIKREDIEQYVRINIRHSVFDKNEYTSYVIIKPQTYSSYILQECKESDSTYIDTENGIYITETMDVSRGIAPKNLAELKKREVAWNEEYVKRFTVKTIEGIDEVTCHSIMKSYIEKVKNGRIKHLKDGFIIQKCLCKRIKSIFILRKKYYDTQRIIQKAEEYGKLDYELYVGAEGYLSPLETFTWQDAYGNVIENCLILKDNAGIEMDKNNLESFYSNHFDTIPLYPDAEMLWNGGDRSFFVLRKDGTDHGADGYNDFEEIISEVENGALIGLEK